jgi:hypothetical protein
LFHKHSRFAANISELARISQQLFGAWRDNSADVGEVIERSPASWLLKKRQQAAAL